MNTRFSSISFFVGPVQIYIRHFGRIRDLRSLLVPGQTIVAKAEDEIGARLLHETQRIPARLSGE